MEDDFEPTVQHQRRINPKIYDVIKKEVLKLLDAGLIYPISDSPWVSPAHWVPKKSSFTIVDNEENELILTRLVTGWRVCIDYRKLNEATRKDHFPHPFMDQMLKRLAGNEYFCFLDGFLGYFQIPIDPKDQEKTTFTCPYGRNYNPKGERFLIASRFPTPLLASSPVIVEPLRIELPFLENQFQEDPLVDPPEVSMADNQTMAELLQEPTEGYEDTIVIPEIAANNFELKHGLINLVQNKQFFGHDKEDPHAHIHSLNSAGGGNFLNKIPQECLKIIESKSKVRQSRAKAVVAKVSTSSSTTAVSSEVSEFKDMARALLLDKKNQSSAPAQSSTPAPVKAIEPNCVTCGGNFNQGQLHRPQVNQPPAYQALAYQAPIPQTQSVTQTDFESYIKDNDALLRNMQSQGQGVQNQCQGLQTQIANLTDMLSKFVSFNTASSSGSGTLPSNTITNPKEDLKGITTPSSVAYQGPPIPTPSKVVKQGTEVAKDQVQTPSSQSTAPVQPLVIRFETQTPISEPVVAPASALIGNKEKLSEMARTPMNKHSSEVILNKLPRKLGDPGKFLIPCEFSGMDECFALVDLGASINLMPLSMWEGLSLLELTPTCMTLKLMDHSVSKPIRIAKYVLVKVGVFHFPADFVVVDFEPDPRVPLILGSHSMEFNPFYYDPEGDILLPEAILNSKPLPPLLNHEQYMPSFKKELKVCEAKTVKSFVDEPPEVELKDLPPHLEYAFLEGDNKLPINIAKELGDEEKSTLIKEKTMFTAHMARLLIDACLSVCAMHRAHFKGNFLSRFDKMLQRCEDTNLSLNWEKSHFMVKEGIVLGHKISKTGLRLTEPKSMSFLNYLIPQPSKKNTPFIFSEDCIKAFQTLKKKLTEALILNAPNWDLPFELMCDASNFAIGAVLGQRHGKHFKPIHYASKTMNDAESNYTTIEKEMLAVVYAFEKFWSYLIMNKSIVHTNHSALKYLFAKKDAKARLLRWVLLLQEFDFKVLDTKGAENLAADHLSC
uniref:RNA-directed DNA polymerase n=1 Tax=Tanacetum cinerariifolium TaxID=118510 RepID=A0A699HU75_TANCI|nr:reverse transcriptase domain-containing protein [Tanacetum cinerariifolium]